MGYAEATDLMKELGFLDEDEVVSQDTITLLQSHVLDCLGALNVLMFSKGNNKCRVGVDIEGNSKRHML